MARPPDVQAAVVAHLSTHPALAGVEVTGEVLDGTCLRVTTTPATRRAGVRLWRVEVALDAYAARGGSTAALFPIVAAALDALDDLAGYRNDSIAVSAVLPGFGPFPLPEPDGRPRYSAAAAIHATHP